MGIDVERTCIVCVHVHVRDNDIAVAARAPSSNTMCTFIVLAIEWW